MNRLTLKLFAAGLICICVNRNALAQVDSIYYNQDSLFKVLKFDSLAVINSNKKYQHLNDSFKIIANKWAAKLRTHGTHDLEEKLKLVEKEFSDYQSFALTEFEKGKENYKHSFSIKIFKAFTDYCKTSGLKCISYSRLATCKNCKDQTDNFIKFLDSKGLILIKN